MNSGDIPHFVRHIEDMPQSVRFVLAGGFAVLISWIVRFPLSLLLPFAAAVAVATVIGMLFSFFAYRKFVFPGSDRALGNQLRDFIIINLVGMAIVTGVSVVFLDGILPLIGNVWQPEAIAHAIGIAVGAFSNFHGHRLLSFRQPDIVPDRQL